LNVWHPWIVLLNRTPRTIKRFLNRLRYVAMRLRSETDNQSLPERIWRKMSGKEKPPEENESAESVPESVLVALGAIYHVNPAWIKDAEILEKVFSESSTALAERLKEAFPQADRDSQAILDAAGHLKKAVVNYQDEFGRGVAPLIRHREAFLEVLAETGM
jgi:hypothetical protein